MRLVCPNCNESFELSADQQTALMNQVRDAAFEEELSKREKEIAKSYDSEMSARIQKVLSEEKEQNNKAMNAKIAEMNDLRMRANQAVQKLESQLKTLQENKDLEVNKAVMEESARQQELLKKQIETASQKELNMNKRYSDLEAELKALKEKKDLEVNKAVMEEQARGQEQLKKQLEASSQKELDMNKKYSDLEAELKALKEKKDLEVSKAVMEEQARGQEQLKKQLEAANQKELDMNKKYSDLEAELTALNQRKDLELKNAVIEATVKQKEEFALELKNVQTELDYYKDLKAKMSTKMIGESLEQHCMAQFNQYRMMAFPNAYFEKDNEVSKSGSKGDFIYREESDGVELLSIMFEMKNENDTTATKHKNEDFFKELDKDRKEKNCEYAILVSLLESEDEVYNTGIVDVSYKYPKMYVIRPQFFIQMIGILRNAALNSLDARKELKQVQEQNIDIMAFQTELARFQGDIGRNYELASKRFTEAVTEIDKSIEHLQKVRNALVKSEDNLRLIDKKTQGMTMKKLTKNSPLLKEELKKAAEGEEQ